MTGNELERRIRMDTQDEDYKPHMVIPGNPDARKMFPDGIRHSIENIEAFKDDHYGLPDKKKYPLPDRDHVLSAIRFFNYVDPVDERRLAKAILKRMRELGIDDVNVGEVNRFKQYYDRSTLSHHGIKGMHWGEWNDETAARYSGKKVFVSGSSKTQSKLTETGEKNPFYRKKLPKEVRKELDRHMESGDKILVGDAPGIDRQVQDYLSKRNYGGVEVFSPGESRYLANKNWKNTKVKVPGAEPGSKEWLAGKDKKMTDLADEGLAVTITDGASATRRNIDRLTSQGKNTTHYEISDKGKRKDRIISKGDIKAKIKAELDEIEILENLENSKNTDYGFSQKSKKLLKDSVLDNRKYNKFERSVISDEYKNEDLKNLILYSNREEIKRRARNKAYNAYLNSLPSK